MPNPMIKIHNATTGEIIDRQMTDVEFAQYKKEQDEVKAEQAKGETKALAKSALLVKLGITEDEAKLLLS